MNDSLGRRLWASVLTGIPFGIFKLATGVYLAAQVHHALGLLLIVWGGLDVALNVAAVAWPRRISYCALSNLGRVLERRSASHRRWEALGLALDTLLAFTAVAGMIWFRKLGDLPPPLGRLWDLAVVANVLGVGLELLWRTWQSPVPAAS